ncbi:Coiled-coil domain-containing protein 57 [Rhizophlyctis rosea]|nr:Coiled-coil domain-containing protein 57 [Rhizophlyctis rosea]
MPDQDTLTNLLSRKEKELRDIYGTLEQTLKEKEQECQELRSRFKSLQDDFVYNLGLLEERDKELERYDVTSEELRSDVHEREARVNELRTLLNEKSYELSQIKTLLQTQEQQHNEALRRMRKEQEQMAQQHEDALQARAEQFEQFRMDLQLELRAAQQQQELQREAFTAEIEKLKKQHEMDLQLYKQKITQDLLDNEHRIASAFAELNAVKFGKEASETAYQQQLEINRNLEKKLKDYQWERADSEKAAAAKVVELEDIVQQLKAQNVSQTLAFEEERTELLSSIAAKEQAFQKDRETYRARMEQQQVEINTVKEEMVDRTTTFKKRVEELQGAVRNKDHILRQTCKDFEQQILRWEEEERVDKEEISERDKVIDALTGRLQSAEAELTERRKDVGVYKQELAKRMDVEARLQQALAEQNAEWTRKFDELQRRRARDQDELIQGLIAAKDRAETESKLLRDRWRAAQANEGFKQRHPGDAAMEMGELDVMPQSLAENTTTLVDEAANDYGMDTLRRQNQELQNQNLQLTEIIHQMRHDMEHLQQAMDVVTGQQAQGVPDVRRDVPTQAGDYSDRPIAPSPNIDTEMYHHEAIHLHRQISKLQSLLQQKQSIIDQLLEQQDLIHGQLEREMLKRRGAAGAVRGTKAPTRRRHHHDSREVDRDDEEEEGDSEDAETDTSRSGRRRKEGTEAVRTLNAINRELRDKLRSAVDDLVRAVAEKNRLVDLSNMLQSELRMVREELERGKERERERVWKDGKDPPKEIPPEQQQPLQPFAGQQRVQGGNTMMSRKVASVAPKISIGKKMVKPGMGAAKVVADNLDKDKMEKLQLRARGVRNWNDKDDEVPVS